MITSGVGGVGKTTVAIALAYGFAKRGIKALLIETIPGCGVLDLILHDTSPILYNLDDVLDGTVEKDDVIITSELGFSYICAPASECYKYSKTELIRFIKLLKQQYDIIIIDTSSGFSDIHKWLIPHTDTIIFTVTPQITDVRITSRFVSLYYRYKIKDTRLIINKVPDELPLSCGLDDLDTVIDMVGVQLLGALPIDNINSLTKPNEYTKKLELESLSIVGRLLGEENDLALYK